MRRRLPKGSLIVLIALIWLVIQIPFVDVTVIAQETGASTIEPAAEPTEPPPPPPPTDTPMPPPPPTDTPVPPPPPTDTPMPPPPPTDTPVPPPPPTDDTPVPPPPPTDDTPVPPPPPTDDTPVPPPPPTDDTPVPPPDDGGRPRRRSDPRLAKAVNTTSARVGDVLVYELTVTVDGNTRAENVVVQDTIPPFMEFVRATTTRGTVAVSGATVVVTIGDVDTSETVTIRIVVRVLFIPDPPVHRNVALLTTTSSTDDPSNNTATTTVNLVPEPDGSGSRPRGPNQPATVMPDTSPTPTLTPDPLTPMPTEVTPLPPTSTPIPPTPTPVPLPQTLPVTGAPDAGLPLPLPIIALCGGVVLLLGLGIRLRGRNKV